MDTEQSTSGSDESRAVNATQINRFRAEFSEHDSESAYRAWSHQATIRQARVTVFASISLIMLYSVIDFLMLPSPQQWLNTLGLRSMIFVIGLAVIYLMKSVKSSTALYTAITLFELMTIGLLMSIFTHYRGDVADAFLSLILIVIAVYLFIPNRFILTVIVATTTCITFLGIIHYIHHASVATTVHISIILMTVNIIGIIYTQRYQIAQRLAHLELMRERHTRKQLQKEIEQRKHLEEQLWHLAQTDALTNLSNRRHFMQEAESEIGRSKRYGHPLSLLMIDIDHFKRVNDTHGHDTGDSVLKQMAGVCQRHLRKNDLLGRLGGEEFAILAQEESADSAKYTGERLRAAIEAHFADTPHPLTISIGITELRVDDAGISDMLKRADNALYDAKHQGRNCIVNAG